LGFNPFTSSAKLAVNVIVVIYQLVDGAILDNLKRIMVDAMVLYGGLN